jgi:uncharacterized protein YaaN involved in tellurite resistance
MTFSQLLERIDEVEQQIQETTETRRQKYYDLLDKLNAELEDKIRRRDYK